MDKLKLEKQLQNLLTNYANGVWYNKQDLDFNVDRAIELEESVWEWINENFVPLDAVVMQKIAELIKVYDEKRIDLLHWRRSGIIPGGIEQTKLIEGFIQDLKEVSNFSA